MPISVIPKRATAEPPSGAETVFPLPENENVVRVLPPALWVVKLQSMAVGSNPLPLTIPLPSIARIEAVCVTTVAERRSKVKPPTLHKPGVGVDGLNVHGNILACVPGAIPAKLPVALVTLLKPALWNTSNQVTTLVAVAKELVSNCTSPAN